MESFANISDEQLLSALQSERAKFSSSDKKKMLSLVLELMLRGVYSKTPAMKKHGYSFLQMVEGYGAYFFRYEGLLSCPHCGADFRNHESGPPFKREIAIVVNDRRHATECPDCKRTI